MNSVGARGNRGRDDLVNIEISLRRRFARKRDGHICLDNVLRIRIRLGIHRNRTNTQRPRSAHDAAGNFPSIRYQQCFHGFALTS